MAMAPCHYEARRRILSDHISEQGFLRSKHGGRNVMNKDKVVELRKQEQNYRDILH